MTIFWRCKYNGMMVFTIIEYIIQILYSSYVEIMINHSSNVQHFIWKLTMSLLMKKKSQYPTILTVSNLTLHKHVFLKHMCTTTMIHVFIIIMLQMGNEKEYPCGALENQLVHFRTIKASFVQSRLSWKAPSYEDVDPKSFNFVLHAPCYHFLWG